MTQSFKYPRCLPYLNSIRPGILSAGTKYWITVFIGIPNISRCRSIPRRFETTARARMANRET